MFDDLKLAGFVHRSLKSLVVRKVIFVLCMATFASASCSRKPETTFAETEVLRRGLGGEPSTLDPAAAVDNFSTQLIQDLYEGLTVESPSGSAIPGIATSWQVDPSGKRYTFQLRANALWSNGKRVTGGDFVNAWRRVLDPAHGSPLANDLLLIEGATRILAGVSPPSSLAVSSPKDDVLVVNLSQPAPFFPELVSHSSAFPIYSEVSARSHGPADWVSNGPYVLKSWQPGTRIELKRNDQYWDKEAVQIETVQYLFASDQNAQYAAYRSGQLDMTDTIPSNQVGSIRSEHPDEVVIAPYLGVAYYGLNFQNSPFNTSRKLGQALAMAVDRSRLVDALALGQVGAFGIVPPGTWNYTPQKWDWASLNDADRITQARKLYADAGYSRRMPLVLRLLYNSNPEIKQTALIVAAMWKEVLGVETALTDEEFRVYLQSRHDKSRWDVVRLAWSADYNDASNFLELFRSGSPNNDTGYSNSLFDHLLKSADDSADQEIRRHMLESAEKVMLNDYPTIPLYFYVSKRLVKPYVSGVKPNALDRVYSKSLAVARH